MQPDPNPPAPAARVRPLPSHHLYEVQLDTEAFPHLVDRTLLRMGVAQMHCTCRETDYDTIQDTSTAATDASSGSEPSATGVPACLHACAVEKYLGRRRLLAARRRERGLTYHGWRNTAPDPQLAMNRSGACVAACTNARWRQIDPAPGQELRNHSPDGFEWGYGGSGPAQLALALLLDYTGDAEVALHLYQPFKEAHIAGLPREPDSTWQINTAEMDSFLLPHGWRAPDAGECVPSTGDKNGRDSMVVLSDEELTFAGYYGGRARCRILLGGRDGESVVVAADLLASSGTSVTNRVEAVAALVCQRYDLDPRRLLFIQQHSLATLAQAHLWEDEPFRLVTFRYDAGGLSEPRWIRVTQRQVEALLGQRLPDAESGGAASVTPIDQATARPA